MKKLIIILLIGTVIASRFWGEFTFEPKIGLNSFNLQSNIALQEILESSN